MYFIYFVVRMPQTQLGHAATHQVYANAEGVWDAMLNQTDIGANKNKYVVFVALSSTVNLHCAGSTSSNSFTQSVTKAPAGYTRAGAASARRARSRRRVRSRP